MRSELGRTAGNRLPRLLCLAMLATAAAANSMAANQDETASERRLVLVRKLVRESLEKLGLDGSVATVRKDVLEKFSKADPCPVEPSSAVATLSQCRERADQMTARLVDKEYPLPDIDKLRQEAAARYPLYEKGEIITVKYRVSPIRVNEKRGVYHGRDGRGIKVGVGGGPILIADIAAHGDNDAKEMLKFDVEQSTALRQALIDAALKESEARRTAYADEVRGLALAAEKERAVAMNERNGYILMDGEWFSLLDIVKTTIRDEKLSIREALEAERQRLARERRRQIQSGIASQTVSEEVGAGIGFTDPQALWDERRQGNQVQPEDVPPETPGSGVTGAGPKFPVVPGGGGVVPGTPPGGVQPPPGDGEEMTSWLFYVVALVIIGGIAGVVVMVVKQKGSSPQKFFKAPAKIQKGFWELAEADPEGFKYVAYRFSSEGEARSALLGLSYMSEATGGEMKCRFSIQHGYYPHKDKFVSYVGGTELGYAMWREASALFPELPHAEYFRVSKAPRVEMDVPDIQQLMADEELNITYVGEQEGEGDDFAIYHHYQAPDKESALAFLEKVEIKSDDAHILVETPEGRLGKDVNGIYEEAEA